MTSKQKKIALVFIVILVIANVISNLLSRETLKYNEVEDSLSSIRGAFSAEGLPDWLMATSSQQQQPSNLFEFGAVDEKIVEEVEQDDNKKKVVQVRPAPTPLPSLAQIKIMAINRDKENASAMIRFENKVSIVFPGDVIGDRYRISAITENEVRFEPL